MKFVWDLEFEIWIFSFCIAERGKGGVLCFMIVVKAGPGDTSDSLIRKFSRKVLAEGILQDLKKREFYQKPAEVRKEKAKLLSRRRFTKKSY